MTATLELFDRWKALRGITSDREAAKVLGLSHGAPAQWRTGRNGSASVIERMAKDLGEDPIPVILQAFAEAARDAEDKRALSRMAKKLAASAMVLVLAWMPYSAPTASVRSGSENAAIYIMRTRAMRKILDALVKAWAMVALRPPRLQPQDMEPVTCNRLALCPSIP